MIATVVTGCLLRPTGVHQSDASTPADSGGGGGGGGGGGIVDAPVEGGMDAPVEGGMDASGNGDPCALGTPIAADTIQCSPGATRTSASVAATASTGDEYCIWNNAALNGVDPSASVLVTKAPASGTGNYAYLKLSPGSDAELSLDINQGSGTFTPSPGAGWGSSGTPGAISATSICIRIIAMPGTLAAEYFSPGQGWQQFASANETLDSPIAVTVGVHSASALMAKANFSEIGTGTP